MKYLSIFLLISITLIWSCKTDDSIINELDSTLQTNDTNLIGDTTVIYDTINIIIDNTIFFIDSLLHLDDSSAVDSFINQHQWDLKIAPDNSTKRFLILEEFVGASCINSPIGTRELLRLDSILGDQLIPVSIHASPFARPQSGTSYTTDFRVNGEHGEEYLTTFNPDFAFPRGIVNRKDKRVIAPSKWFQDITLMRYDNPLAILKLSSYLSKNSNILRAEVEIEWLQSVTDSFNLQINLIEDHLVDWQKDATDPRLNIPDYEHRHVLRKVINNTFGTKLKTSAIGEKETYQYIFPFESTWKKKDLKIVAFIFNQDPSSYEIVQANSVHIK